MIVEIALCVGEVGLAFVTGGLAGAAVALLLAPQSGRESREQVRGYARRAGERVQELADMATQVMDQAVDKGREVHQRQAGGRGRAHGHAVGV